jgi:arylsulfatase
MPKRNGQRRKKVMGRTAGRGNGARANSVPEGNGRSPQAEAFPQFVMRESYPPLDYTYPRAKIGLTYQNSAPDYPPPPAAPPDAPNILVVLLDDVGYGWCSTFGGLVETPTLDYLASEGLRYTCFHTTALCSPTRAALLTGRNHHTVATGVIQEMATGYPGYSGMIPRSCATVAETLRQNGYATGWWGKNHNVPDNQNGPTGPFDLWPTRLGFDYFYGFIGGETDQFYPALVRGTIPVEPPQSPEEGYHFTRDITDDCITWMRFQKSISPDRPFFAYYATGAAHAPHQPPLDWRGRHSGKFDMGWDRYRTIVHQRQLELGVIPEGTKLTPRPDEIPAWNEASPDEKKLYARFAENYADYLAHTDHEVGRLVSAIEELGIRDDTLVIYIVGDNGCSAEGTLHGCLNEMQSLGGEVMPPVEDTLQRIDEIGLPGSAPHYPVGWALAGDTPFQWTKQIASHFGGTRNPVVMSWPARIQAQGGIRGQFHHSIDIAPTLLEVAGIAEPHSVNGVPQKPIEGVSMAYTFTEEGASAPSTRTTQYFEMFGHRALYNDGWIACCRHGHMPWETGAATVSFDDDVWELYRLDGDFSEAHDLAKKYPDKLRQLQDMFVAEAAKYNVLPLDDRFADRLDITMRPSVWVGRKEVTFFPGMTRLPEGSGPAFNNVSHRITIPVELVSDDEGVLFCLGGDVAGWSLYLLNGHLVYHYNYFDVERFTIRSDQPLPAGQVEIGLEFLCETEKRGGPALVGLFANGEQIGAGRVERQVRTRFGLEPIDVGMDTLSPVSKEYPKGKPRFPFTGRIEHVRVEFLTEAQARSLQERFEEMVALE